MNEGKHWQALRYVLDDPTLDRIAFEQQMLDDVDLALTVAAAVEQVNSVQSAVTASSHVSLLPVAAFASSGARTSVATVATSTHSQPWYWSGVAALAAALMLAAVFGVRELNSHRLGISPSPVAVGTAEQTSDARLSTGTRSAEDRARSAESSRSSVQTTASQYFVAEHWLASGRESAPSDLFDGSDLRLSGDDARELLPSASDAEIGEEEDWMLRAAREFYSQGVAS